ncbi:MAG: OmpA family protein [Bacteroidota bacterium]
MGFLATKDNAIFELTPGKSYEKDFKLTQIPFCGPIAPSILFYKNSILSCNDSLRQKDSSYYESFQNTISILYLSLIEEPSIIIEIHGHASSNEKNSEHLALYRAQLIKEILVAKGINKKRMVVKSWGHNKLIVSNKIIKKAKTKEEKSALHTRNQRVVYRVISWDFAEDKN